MSAPVVHCAPAEIRPKRREAPIAASPPMAPPTARLKANSGASEIPSPRPRGPGLWPGCAIAHARTLSVPAVSALWALRPNQRSVESAIERT